MKKIIFIIIIVCSTSLAWGQVSVAVAPPLHFQFTDANGVPLANGKIFSYAAGTTTLQNTYADGFGLIQNPNPIPLDATGSPSNGSVQTGIFLSNTSWKFVAYDVNNVQQWSVDNVTTYFGFLSTANLWTAAQSFAAAITDTLTDNQMIFGISGNQTTLDLPPPTGNVTLHMPTISDTIMGRTTFDTETNKTLTAPTITNPVINGVPVPNVPGTYLYLLNNNTTGTSINLLTKFTGAPASGIIASTSDTSGIVGVAVSGAGTSGYAVIQQTGNALCQFDASTTAGDWVQISSTNAGMCHDSGIPATTYPSAPTHTQIIGIAQSTNVGIGTYFCYFYSPNYFQGGVVGGTPSPVPGVAAGGGTASVGASSKDTVGSISVTTGAGPTTGNLVVVNFSTPHIFATLAYCTITPATSNAAAATVSAQFTVGGAYYAWSIYVNGTPLAASTTYVWVYTCLGY